MKVFVVTTCVEPWSESECPTYVFKKEPTRKQIEALLGKWDVIIQLGGIKKWEDQWSFNSIELKIIES